MFEIIIIIIIGRSIIYYWARVINWNIVEFSVIKYRWHAANIFKKAIRLVIFKLVSFIIMSRRY